MMHLKKQLGKKREMLIYRPRIFEGLLTLKLCTVPNYGKASKVKTYIGLRGSIIHVYFTLCNGDGLGAGKNRPLPDLSPKQQGKGYEWHHASSFNDLTKSKTTQESIMGGQRATL